MAKGKVTDLRKAYPELEPDKDYPPLRFKSLNGVFAPHAKLHSQIIPSPPENTTERSADRAHGAPARMSWARCSNGSSISISNTRTLPVLRGRLKIIAAIEEPAVIARILTHMGLPARAPPHLRRADSIYSKSWLNHHQDRFSNWPTSRSARTRASVQTVSKSATPGPMHGPKTPRKTAISLNIRAIDYSRAQR